MGRRWFLFLKKRSFPNIHLESGDDEMGICLHILCFP